MEFLPLASGSFNQAFDLLISFTLAREGGGKLTSLLKKAVMVSLSSKLTLCRSTAAMSVKTTSSISNGRTVFKGISAIWNWDPCTDRIPTCLTDQQYSAGTV